MTPAERLARLRLARSENVGPVAFAELIRRFEGAERALAALPGLARRPLRIATREEAEQEIAAGERLGARLICAGEAAFPTMLAQPDPPPPVLWVLGRGDLLLRSSVAIVGARTASASGQRFARGLAVGLGEAGLVVVSGLARGIDGAAHEGSLPTGTVAVLGGGVDDIYPPEHVGLYGRIAERGCLVSENPPGRRAVAKDFPRRNRIIAGLARGVVVVEAELRSGSLITARIANEQGREVFAVPGSPLDPRAKGTNGLIREGATLCESAEDVLRVLETLPALREPEPDAWRAEGGDEAASEALRAQVLALLSPTPVSRDELVRATGAPSPAVMAALVELSLEGLVELSSGGLAALS